MSEHLTHWKSYCNTDYIGAYAFQKDEEKTLIIKSVTREIVTGPENRTQECTIIHWHEKEKPMVVNKTNAKVISKIAESSYVEEWVDVRVTLFVKTVSAFGEEVEAVRVSKKRPAPIQDTSCSECGELIRPTELYTAAQILSAGLRKYGRPVCMTCAGALGAVKEEAK